MARPAHVPDAVWSLCDAEAEWRIAPEATAAGLASMPAGITPVDVGMAGGAAIGLVGQAVTRAIAPDADTARAWSWNHVMKVCLENRGLRLP